MTKLGDYFKTKSVNKAEVSRKTGIGKNRLSELSTKESAKIRGEEIYLIGLAIDVPPSEILEVTCGDLKLKQ